jgi:hypothetical protein
MAQLVAPAVSFVGMIRQVQRVERPVAPQSQPSAEDTPTSTSREIDCPGFRKQNLRERAWKRQARVTDSLQGPTSLRLPRPPAHRGGCSCIIATLNIRAEGESGMVA